MKSLFEPDSFQSIQFRLAQLQPDSTAKWGKMNVGQMLAHCKEALKVPLNEEPVQRMFLGRLLGWMMKSKLYNEEIWKRNLPTAPDFKITGTKDFTTEKNSLLALLQQFHDKKEAGLEQKTHPFFGKFTGEQWGKAMYKHLNHHLQQFGV